jgi:hypothetical protein
MRLQILVRFCRPLDALQINAFFRHFIQGRKFTQTKNGFYHSVANVVDFGFGVETPDAESDRAVR